MRAVVLQVLQQLGLDLGNLREESTGDGDERLVRPRLEPVDDGAVDERGEVPRADPELVTDGREAEAHVQVLPHLVQEEIPQVLRRVQDASLLHLLAHVVAHLLLLLVGHQVRDVSRAQQVVDVHEEALLDDLAVGHQERHRLALGASLLVQLEEVNLKVGHAVGRRDGNLENLKAADERGESGERLLAGAADADQHGVAAREIQDPGDSRHVVHGLVEEHEVHHSVALVVLVELVHQSLVQLLVGIHRAVRAVVLRVVLYERVVGDGASLDRLHVLILEVLLGHGDSHVVELFDVADERHAIAEHALALVDPQPHEVRRVGVKLGKRAADALGDVGQLAEVPLVVKLDRRRQEGVGDQVVKLDGGVGNLLGVLGDVRIEVLEVPVDDLREHGGDHRLARHLHRKGGEVSLHARRDVERTGGGVHARHVLAVEHLLEHDLLLVVPALVVDVLTRQLDRRLGVVLVHVGHVEIVEEVDHSLGAGRAEANSRLLLQRLLHDHLKRGRVHEVVHVDRAEAPVLRVQRAQSLAHQRRLARARVADEHAVVLVLDEAVEEVGEPGGLHGRHEYVGESLGRVVAEALHLLLPRSHLHRHRVDVVVENQPLLGVQDVLPLRHPPLAELRAVVHRLVHQHRAAQRPRRGEHELHLHEFAVRRGGAARRLLRDHPVENLAHGARDVHGHQRHDRAEGAAAVLQRPRHVPVEEFDEDRPVLGSFSRLDPGVDHGLPADVVLVQVDDAASRHRRRGTVEHVVDLEEKAHGARERNALVGREREHLVVVHDGVHGLDPLGVDVAVQHDPLVNVGGVVAHVAKRHGHQALLPLASRRVEEAVELVARDSFGVHGNRLALLPVLVLRVQQSLPHRRLPAAGGTEQENGPSHGEDLPQLCDLEHEHLLGLVSEFDGGFGDLSLEGLVALSGNVGEHLGEQVVEQAHEDSVVVRGELSEVEVAQSLEQDLVLREMRLVALQTASDVQRRLDRAELPVVMRRRGEQILAESVEDHKLAREELGHLEALAHEHVLADHAEVGDAHGHRAEERLERLGQLGAPGVTRVHGYERHGRRPQRNLHILEHKLALLGANGVQHRLVLGGAHGEHRDGNAVELVEAAPRARLRQTLVGGTHSLVVHLVRAVEDVHLDAESAAEVLHRLRLAGTRGTRGCAAQHEPLRLREGDHASIGERRDDETSGRADVLVHVGNLRVADVDLEFAGLLVGAVAELRGPLERVRDVHLFVDELLAGIASVHVDGAQRQHLLAVQFLEFAVDSLDDPLELVELFLQQVLHRVVVAVLEPVERLVDLLREDEARHGDGVLRRLLKHPLGPRHLIVLGHGQLELVEQRRAHRLDDDVEPLLHGALAHALARERDVLLLAGPHRDRILGRVAHLVGLEREVVDVVEALGQVPQDHLRVGTLGQDVEKIRGGDEVEAREGDPLRLEVILQRLLAHLEQTQHPLEVLEPIVDVARLDDVGDVRGVPHHVRELRVDAVEPLGILRQLHADILRPDEDALQHAPLLRDIRPDGQHAVHRAELLLPLVHDLLELRALHVLVRAEVLEQQVVVLERLDDEVVDDDVDHVRVRRERDEIEVQTRPILLDLHELLLDDQLLLRALDNLGDAVRAGVQLESEEVAQRKLFVHRELLPRHLLQELPVSLPHRGMPQLRHERQRGEQRLDLITERAEDVVLRATLGQLLRLLLQLLGLLDQVVHVDLVPQRGVPRGERVNYRGDHVPEELQVGEILAGLAKRDVVGDDELEQVLLLVELRALHDDVGDRAKDVLAVLLPVVEVVQRRVRGLDGVGRDLALDGEGRELLEEFPEILNLLREGVGGFANFASLELLHHAQLLLDVETLLLERAPRQRRLLELLEDVLADADAVRLEQRHGGHQRLEHPIRLILALS